MDLAARFHLPLIATNGVCHATPEERELMDVLTCVRHQNHHRQSRTPAGKRIPESHLKPARKWRPCLPMSRGIAGKTRELGRAASYTLADLGYQFPALSRPQGETDGFAPPQADRGRRARAAMGPHGNKAPGEGRVRKQIERELALIEKTELPGYFLIVWDIVKYCRDNNILVQGPRLGRQQRRVLFARHHRYRSIGMDLLFERFLSENRGEWPDIASRSSQRRSTRARPFNNVYERYGRLARP